MIIPHLTDSGFPQTVKFSAVRGGPFDTHGGYVFPPRKLFFYFQNQIKKIVPLMDIFINMSSEKPISVLSVELFFFY